MPLLQDIVSHYDEVGNLVDSHERLTASSKLAAHRAAACEKVACGSVGPGAEEGVDVDDVGLGEEGGEEGLEAVAAGADEAARAGCGGVEERESAVECRTSEAKLGSLDPFTGVSGQLHFKPVAVLNRFDLSPTTFATCGESRIVYWMDSGASGRASIIVEGVSNP